MEHKKASIRGALLAVPTLERRTIKYGEHEVEVRELTCEEKTNIIQTGTVQTKKLVAGKLQETAERDVTRQIAAFAVYATFVPGTNTKVFDTSDIEQLMQGKAGESFLDEITDTFVEFMGFATAIAKKNANLEATQKNTASGQ